MAIPETYHVTIGEEHEEVVAHAQLVAVLTWGLVNHPSQQSQAVSFFLVLAEVQG